MLACWKRVTGLYSQHTNEGERFVTRFTMAGRLFHCAKYRAGREPVGLTVICHRRGIKVIISWMPAVEGKMPDGWIKDFKARKAGTFRARAENHVTYAAAARLKL